MVLCFDDFAFASNSDLIVSRYPIPKSVYGDWKAAINRAEIGEPDPIDIDKGKERAQVYSSESSEDDSDAARCFFLL